MKDAAALYERMIVVRCQAGDEAALKELIARYSPGLRFFLRKMTADAYADDLLQETWIDVYTKVSRLQNPGAFAAWVYRIARDKAYRQLRQRPRPESLDNASVPEAAAEEPDFSVEDAHSVRVALDELPLEQREVLILRFIEEMSYEEIAQVIARPVGTVRSRIHYAKLALRAKIELATIGKEK